MSNTQFIKLLILLFSIMCVMFGATAFRCMLEYELVYAVLTAGFSAIFYKAAKDLLNKLNNDNQSGNAA